MTKYMAHFSGVAFARMSAAHGIQRNRWDSRDYAALARDAFLHAGDMRKAKAMDVKHKKITAKLQKEIESRYFPG